MTCVIHEIGLEIIGIFGCFFLVQGSVFSKELLTV